MKSRQRKIAIVLLLAILAAFFYLGKNNSDQRFEELNQGIRTVTQWIEEQLDLEITDKSEAFVPSLDDSILSVHVLDVGQGESILIRSTQGDILIDAGETASGADVAKYLDHQGVTRLELIVATHPHSDHIGGLAHIISTFEVGQVVMPEIPDDLVPTSKTFTRFLKAIDTKALTLFSVSNDTNYDFGEAQISFLSPIEESPDLNNLSAIVRLDVNEISFLFTGDAEEWAEQVLLDNNANIQADVLNIAHHGSKTSTDEIFLAKVNPDLAVISCGIDNSYGHPHREIIELLEEKNIKIYRTDLDGTIVFETNGTEISVITEN